MTDTVLITGASQGIGRETALLFARKGYNVVLAARHAERLEAVAQEIRSMGQSALAIPTDVTDSDQVNALVQKALEHYGTSLEDWHACIDTNLWGYIHTINVLLPHFLARRSGTIVNVNSIGGKVPTPYLVPYCTSKFAVAGLTEALHGELSPKGIRVCGIYPNLIKSNFLERAIFRGVDEEDTQARRHQVEEVLKNLWWKSQRMWHKQSGMPLNIKSLKCWWVQRMSRRLLIMYFLA
jgi:NADP-dependent 3-hydroxy acid dehydrogenase YdfG